MNLSNPYNTRWRWWYSAIADWMIRNPGGTLQDCAKELGRAYGTIRMIHNTDMFQTYLDERKKEWRHAHDFSLVHKLTKVAESGLDQILETMAKKGDQIPMKMLNELTTGALDRLGYAPAAATPSVQVNVNQDQRKQVMVAAPPALLEEAREAMRIAQEKQRGSTAGPLLELESLSPRGVGMEAEPQVAESEEGEDFSAPLTISTQ